MNLAPDWTHFATWALSSRSRRGGRLVILSNLNTLSSLFSKVPQNYNFLILKWLSSQVLWFPPSSDPWPRTLPTPFKIFASANANKILWGWDSESREVKTWSQRPTLLVYLKSGWVSCCDERRDYPIWGVIWAAHLAIFAAWSLQTSQEMFLCHRHWSVLPWFGGGAIQIWPQGLQS